MSETVSLDFGAVAQTLGLPASAATILNVDWDASSETSRAANPGFLSVESITGACHYLRMDSEIVEVLVQHAPDITGCPAFKRLALHCYYLFFLREPRVFPNLLQWPMLPEHLGLAAHLFYVYVLLAGLPRVQAFHRERGIPEEISVDTLRDLELWMRAYRDLHGVWGLQEVIWLEAHHFRGRVYKLGRLQFELHHWTHDFRAFRDSDSRQIVVLAGPGLTFRSDGQFDGTNGIFDGDRAWISTFSQDRKLITGHPITVEGRALNKKLKLAHPLWRVVLEKGDPTLNVHIPATGPLSATECAVSFDHAARFFPRYFPEHRYRAFECDSWLLDHQLAQYLPEHSNIVQFQRMFYRLPSPTASDAQTLERVFDRRFTTLDTAPQKTSLQRHIITHMRNGGHWHTALGLCFPEDLEQKRTYCAKISAGMPWEIQ